MYGVNGIVSAAENQGVLLAGLVVFPRVYLQITPSGGSSAKMRGSPEVTYAQLIDPTVYLGLCAPDSRDFLANTVCVST